MAAAVHVDRRAGDVGRKIRGQKHAPATSDGLPGRCSGTLETISSNFSRVRPSSIPVSTIDGQTTFARMPEGPNSRAMVRVRLTTPPFEAA